jgi:hypothetical protein
LSLIGEGETKAQIKPLKIPLEFGKEC